MNLTDTLTNLLENGCQSITIGKPPEQGPGGVGRPETPAFFAVTSHVIPTGPTGNVMKCDHQTTGQTIAECLNRLIKQIDEAIVLKKDPPAIVVPMKRNGDIVAP